MIEVMRPYQEQLVADQWRILEVDAEDVLVGQKLRAACLLAAYAPDDARWESCVDQVSVALLEEDPSGIQAWIDLLRPVGRRLVDPLTIQFRDPTAIESTRALASRVLAEFSKDDHLTELVLDADATQFPFLFQAIESDRWTGTDALLNELNRRSDEGSDEGSDEERVQLARRQRNAAIALMRLGRCESTFPLLGGLSDSTARTRLMLDMREFGVPLKTICDAISEADTPTARQALLIAAESFAKSRRSGP